MCCFHLRYIILHRLPRFCSSFSAMKHYPIEVDWIMTREGIAGFSYCCTVGYLMYTLCTSTTAWTHTPSPPFAYVPRYCRPGSLQLAQVHDLSAMQVGCGDVDVEQTANPRADVGRTFRTVHYAFPGSASNVTSVGQGSRGAAKPPSSRPISEKDENSVTGKTAPPVTF